jgi:hypothetical protein
MADETKADPGQDDDGDQVSEDRDQTKPRRLHTYTSADRD